MTTSLDANKHLARRYLKAMHSADWETVKSLLHPDHRFHFPLAPEPLDGEAHVDMSMGVFNNAFVDMQSELFDQIAEGDRVVSRGAITMRHVGDFNGIPPTDRTVHLTFTNIIEFVDGKVRNEWDEIDALRMLRELGAIP